MQIGVKRENPNPINGVRINRIRIFVFNSDAYSFIFNLDVFSFKAEIRCPDVRNDAL